VNLIFEKFDGRSRSWTPIIDQDTGEEVGTISCEGLGSDRYGGIYVSLFGDKYRVGFHRYDECVGFVRGVETVLNRVARDFTEIPGIRQAITRKQDKAA
jgi:hypothetical protein